ncbi:hypothetical protein ABFX02_14G053200 [Erythranthe guttata]
MEHYYFKLFVCILVVLFGIAKCDIEKDKEKCANELLGISTCLPYVGGEAKAPSMDCCTGFKQVLRDNIECICILIKDRDDPSLGLKINATLALGLPTRCHAPTNQTVQDCPAILHLPPNSPDAKVFEDLAKTTKKSNVTSPAPGSSPNGTTTTTTTTSINADEKNGGGNIKRWLGTQLVLLALIAAHILPINI